MIVNWTLNIGYPNAIRSGAIDIDEEDLEDMSKDEQDEYISECVRQEADNYVYIDWSIKKLKNKKDDDLV